MKSLKLKKLVAVVVAAATIATVSPIGASAAWKQDSNGWWNTEGNSYSIGWESINGSWYYFGSDGYMKTGWANDNGTWYYMQPSGAMKTGWVNDNGTWYFTSVSGAMQTGVVEVDGKVYSLAANGAMQTGNVAINGVTYTFDASGAAVGDKIPTTDKAFSGAGIAQSIPSKDTDKDEDKSSGGGSSHHSSSHHEVTETFYDYVNNHYGAYVQNENIKIEKQGENGDLVSFKVTFDPQIKLANQNDFVTKDIIVTNADGTDADIQYNNGVYTVKASNNARVYSSVRVYRDGQIGYVTSTPKDLK